MQGLLQGCVAAVTGGARALGLGIAQALARQGAHVLLVGRDAAALQKATAMLQAADGQAHYLVTDVAAAASGDMVVNGAVAAFGRLDILVNCAGAFAMQPLLDVTPEAWQRTLATNLSAPFLLTQAFVRYKIQQGEGGSVINIGSVHGSVGDAQTIPQCASKYGLVGLTRAMAEACRGHNIRVNAIAPGAIEPESADRLSTAVGFQVTQGDVAQLAVYLSSHLANAVTGAVVDLFGITRPVIATS